MSEVSNANVVDQVSVSKGIMLAEYFKSHARRVMQVLGESVEEKILRKIIDWIHRKENIGVRPREILSAKVVVQEKANSSYVKDLLDMLVQRGVGEWRKELPGASGQSKPEKFFLL